MTHYNLHYSLFLFLCTLTENKHKCIFYFPKGIQWHWNTLSFPPKIRLPKPKVRKYNINKSSDWILVSNYFIWVTPMLYRYTIHPYHLWFRLNNIVQERRGIFSCPQGNVRTPGLYLCLYKKANDSKNLWMQAKETFKIY